MKALLEQFYDNTILRFPGLVLLLVLSLCVLAATHVPNTKFDASADSLVLEGDKDLDYYRQILRRYQSPEFLIITYTPKAAILSDESLATLESLKSELLDVFIVKEILSIADVPLLYSPKLSLNELNNGLKTLQDTDVDRDLALQEFRNSPVYKELILSADGKTTAFQLTLKTDPQLSELLYRREQLRKAQRLGQLSERDQAELITVETAYRSASTRAAEQQRKDIEQIRAIMAKYRNRADLFLGGVPMIAADMITFIESDLFNFGTGVIIFIIFTMALIFRKPRWVLLPLSCCCLAALLVLGYLAAIDWRLTVISSNFVSLLLIICLQITIHLVVRYRELHSEHPDWEQKQLVRSTVHFMFRPCLYTALTTIVAFASLVISGIRPVIDFGWMMTIGIVVALLVAFVILPAGLLLLPKGQPRDVESGTVTMTSAIANFTANRGGMVLGGSLLIAIISAIGISRLEVENRFIDYFHDSTEIYGGMKLIDEKLGGTTPLDIILDVDPNRIQPVVDTSVFNTTEEGDPFAEDGDPFAAEDDEYANEGDPFASDDPFAEEEDPFATGAEATDAFPDTYWFTISGLRDIERLHDYLEAQPEIGKVQSLATAYKVARDLNNGDLDDFQLAFMRRLIPADVQNSLLSPYLNDEANQTRMTMRVIDSYPGLKRAELLERIERDVEQELGFKPDQVHLTSMLVLYNNMLQSLFRSQILTLGAVFIGIMLMFMVLFRSISIALIALTPNMLAAAIVLGAMGWAGVPLDMMTITIAAIVIGIGVDDTIHYIHRYQEEFKTHPNYREAMLRSHRSIGKAIYYTSLTVIAGFSILSLSNFVPTIYFGLLTGFAMFAALLGALTLLPRLILLFKPLGPEQNASQPTPSVLAAQPMQQAPD